jgi:predicted ATPase
MAGRRYLITGGPGAGKTAIIEALRLRGFRCVDEAARRIIQAQTRIGGEATHTGDRRLYLELMLSHSIVDYERAAGEAGAVFFDRGIPELIGYCRLVGIEVPAHLTAAARLYRYASPVFVAPPWQAIYRNDSERRQDFEEAVATCGVIREACIEAGYETIYLPLASVPQRVDFILARVDPADRGED